MARLLPNIYNFHPKSFLLPGQFSELRSFMFSVRKKSKRTFIVKPDRGSQGRGILLIQDPDHLDDYAEVAVAQRYISPFLLDDLKFDLRIYVLLTSVDPLRIYIYREGMARFCTEKYMKPSPRNLDQVFSHLTNYSLNKRNEHFQQPEDAIQADTGNKRSLSSILPIIEKLGFDVDLLQSEIDNLVRLTIASVQPFLANSYHAAIPIGDGRSRCFEILGFDVLLDEHLHPWLLEVNCMPSFACDSPFDENIKSGVIKGALKIANITPTFKKLVLSRDRAAAQMRISGATNLPIPVLFDPEVETAIAKTTQWRQVFPLDADHPGQIQVEEALRVARESPVGAAIETTASRARKEAVLAQIKEKNEQTRPTQPRRFVRKYEPPTLGPTKTPRQRPVSVLKPTKVPGVLREEKIITVFQEAAPNFVNEEEEGERLTALREQMMIESARFLLREIQRLLEGISHERKKVQRAAAAKQARHGMQLHRPLVAYRQILVSEGVQ
jgi:tubulin polyglutamylase TTLL6/13